MSGEATEALSSQLAALSSRGDLDEVAVEAGRLAGRVEVLLWAQSELTAELALLVTTDKFADTRGLENMLTRVRDSLMRVQDGSGMWSGLVRTALDAAGTVPSLGDEAPSGEMGG